MSVIATLQFHLEGEPLHVHFTALGEAIAGDNPRQWAGVLRELEGALSDYATKVGGVRQRLEAQLDELDEQARAEGDDAHVG